MPYIGKEYRPDINKAVEEAVAEFVGHVKTEDSNWVRGLEYLLHRLSMFVEFFVRQKRGEISKDPGEDTISTRKLAMAIVDVIDKSKDPDAWIGALNYTITRLIQLIPRKLVELRMWKEEFRYHIYAKDVGCLTSLAGRFLNKPEADEIDLAIGGVLVDVKDEFKRRVNAKYERIQMEKNGDAYDGPYKTDY